MHHLPFYFMYILCNIRVANHCCFSLVIHMHSIQIYYYDWIITDCGEELLADLRDGTVKSKRSVSGSLGAGKPHIRALMFELIYAT